MFLVVAACNQSKKLKHLPRHPLATPPPHTPWERCWAKKHSKAKKAFAYSARNANQPFLCLALWNMHELRGQIGELGNKPATGGGGFGDTYNVARLICISLSVFVVVAVIVVAVVVIFQIISAIQSANFSNV